MVTVGYGDVYPVSYLGRATVCIAIFWGGVTLSMAVLELDRSLRLTNKDIGLMKTIIIKKKACRCIALTYKLKYCISVHGWDHPRSEALHNELLRSLKVFKKERLAL